MTTSGRWLYLKAARLPCGASQEAAQLAFKIAAERASGFGPETSCAQVSERIVRVGLGFELPSKKTVIGPHGAKIDTESLHNWLHELDSSS